MGALESSNDSASMSLGLLGDNRRVDRIKQLGRGNRQQQARALVTAARQFQSMLTKMWVDEMRASNETINEDSPLHSKYSAFFEDMLAEQQVNAGNTAGSPLNQNSLTYLIVKQFSKSLGDEGKELLKELQNGTYSERVSPGPVSFNQSLIPYRTPRLNSQAAYSSLKTSYSDLPDSASMRSFSSPEDFVDKMMPYAVRAVEGIGFNPLVLVAQAALETGWGEHVPAGNNYFGIKAGSSWQGETESLSSTEYQNGRYVNIVSKFRKYSDVMESMEDYIDFVTSNPRYQKAAARSYDPDRYFEEIAHAGYATDPDYAGKLKTISRKIAFMAYK